MEGRTHLFCTFMFLGAAAFLAIKAGYIGFYESLLFLGASFEGVLLPDIDANKSLITKVKFSGILKFVVFFAQTIAYATKFVLYLFLKLILLFYGKSDKHRGIMHSFKGLVAVCIFWLAIGYFVLSYFNAMKYLFDLIIIVLGLLSGYLMHLWQDSLTVSGVQFTSKFKIKGWLKTGRHEWVLQLFFLVVCAIAANSASTGNFVFSFLSLLFALPLSFLLFVR
jgi:inner membrane protein